VHVFQSRHTVSACKHYARFTYVVKCLVFILVSSDVKNLTVVFIRVLIPCDQKLRLGGTEEGSLLVHWDSVSKTLQTTRQKRKKRWNKM